MAKTLWLLDYFSGNVGVLVPLYAETEEDARLFALEWAKQKGITTPFEPELRHYPHGFMLQFTMIPGTDPSEE